MKYGKQLIASLLFFMTFSISAYDVVGHRIIADVAYHNLNKKAKKQVDNLLGKRGIIYTASWADEVKSDSTYRYSYAWHFQNLKQGLTTDEIVNLKQNPTVEGEHLFYAMDMMINRLKQNKKDAEALKFLVHLVGDLHQPMHMGRPEDLGGNRIKWEWFGREARLHAIWDGNMIDSRKMSSSEYCGYLLDKFSPEKKKFAAYTVVQSIEASYSIANKIYAYDYSNKNNYHYTYLFMDDVDEMLYRGGMQLANILNDIFGRCH